MKTNKDWHLIHKMPTKASFEERVKWHIEHSKNCQCRPIPPKLMEEMKLKNIKID